MGIGHPLLEKGAASGERLAGTVCAADGLDDPMMVVDVSSRVTDVATQSRRAIVGITRRRQQLQAASRLGGASFTF